MMPNDQLTVEERAAYDDYLTHGGEVIYLPPSPIVEEPEWMYDLEEVVGAPILDAVDVPCDIKPADHLDHARPYMPRYTSEQDWRDTWG